MPKTGNGLRIILWDIENVQNLAAVFALYGNDYINPENIVQEKYLVCAAWKILGEKTTHSVSILDDPKLFKKDPHNDYHVLKTLHGVLASADVIVHHNGNNFDIKVTEGRMLMQGFTPLPPIIKIDTLKIAKGRFALNANRLDYLGHILGVGRKVKTTPGLWLEVLKGNKTAIRVMEKYNRGDVELLERVFLKLRPYAPEHVNRELFGQDGCPRCGSNKLQRRGLHRAISRVYQRWQCQKCLGWFKTAKAEPKVAKYRVI